MLELNLLTSVDPVRDSVPLVPAVYNLEFEGGDI